jgi:hypothetical protein
LHVFAATTVPASVEIKTKQISTVVSCDNAIRVDHRHDLDLVVLTQILALFIFGQKEIDESFTHEGARSLPWMLSSNDQNQRFILCCFGWIFDGQNLYLVIADCIQECLLLQQFSFVLYFEETISVAIEICQSIGKAMGDQQYVLVVRGRYFESQSVVVASGVFDLVVVLEVLNCFSASEPSLFVLFELFH